MFGSKKLTSTQAKYGAPKLEFYAAYYFILKNHSYLCPRNFKLRVDNQALSWLKLYSTDQAIIGRRIMALEKNHFSIEKRPRKQHRKSDGLSKRTNDYKKQLKGLPPIAEKKLLVPSRIRQTSANPVVRCAWTGSTGSSQPACASSKAN